MAYNYRKLLGRIREYGLTNRELAEKIGITKGTLSQKLNGRYPFTTKDIDLICGTLDIPAADIGTYFFAK